MSTRATCLIGLAGQCQAAAAVPGGGLQPDLGARLLPRDVERFRPSGSIPVTAVWLPPFPADDQSDRSPWPQLVDRAANAWMSSVLVVELPAAGVAGAPIGRFAATAESLRMRSNHAIRLAIGLRARSLEGGRPHLVQLRALRRLAEEWDLAVAVDLSGPLDQRWEAEAAMARLGPRVVLVQVPAAALEPVPIGRARVAMRGLSTALDQRQPPHVAVVPQVAPWQLASPKALAASYAAAADRLAERLRRLRDRDIPPFPIGLRRDLPEFRPPA